MRRSNDASRWLLALALVTTLGASLGRAETSGQKDYRDGVRSIEDGDYEIAVRKLRSAIKEDASEGTAKFRTTGVNFEDYFPHYYLGVALEKLGQTEDALKELQASDAQGAIRKKDKLYRNLQSLVAKLQAVRVAQVKPTATPIPPPPPPPPTSPPRPAPTAAAIRIERPTAAPTVPPPSGPTRTPTRAILKISPPPAASPPPAVPTTPAAPALDTQTRDALRGGIRSYLKGDFGAASATLESIAVKVPVARLFLSYALASQYLLSEKKDSGLAERAKREYETARKEGAPRTQPDLISPGVLHILTGE